MAVASDLQQVALRASDKLPGFSVVLPQALSLCAREDVISIAELVTVIERDVVMTGSLLSLANSAFYSRGEPIVGLRPAVVRLGIRKTRNVLLGLSVVRTINKVAIPAGWSSERFNAHCVASAILSDLIVQNAPARQSEWAFVTGLLHDIGLLLIGAGLPEHFGAVTAHSGSDVELLANERELLGFTHFELGAAFLKKWNYPPAVQEAVRLCPQISLQYEQPFRLAAIISAATRLADSNHITIFGPGEEDSAILTGALRIADPEKFQAAFEREYQAFQSCPVGAPS